MPRVRVDNNPESGELRATLVSDEEPQPVQQAAETIATSRRTISYDEIVRIRQEQAQAQAQQGQTLGSTWTVSNVGDAGIDITAEGVESFFDTSRLQGTSAQPRRQPERRPQEPEEELEELMDGPSPSDDPWNSPKMKYKSPQGVYHPHGQGRPNQKFKGVLLDGKGSPIKGSEFINYKTRAFCVESIVYAHKSDINEYYFLLYQDGEKGSKTFKKWKTPRTHIRFGETRYDSLCRKLTEIFGLKIRGWETKEWGIEDHPMGEEEDIVSKYLIQMDYGDVYRQMNHSKNVNTNTQDRGGKKGEVSSIRLVPYSEIDQYDLDPTLRTEIENLMEQFIRI